MTRDDFSGFSLPDGAWLPPELLYLLPLFSSLSELKVLIATIYHYMQVSENEELTLNDLEDLTGLSRQSVVTAIKKLLGDNDYGLQFLERTQQDRTFTYRPYLDESLKVRLSDGEPPKKSLKVRLKEGENGDESLKVRLMQELGSLSKSDRELINNLNLKNLLSDSLNYSNIDSLKVRLMLLKELRAAGVYLKTAQGLVSNYSEERIRQKMKFFKYAMQSGFANSPGWLVAAIKEDWPEPLGYEENENGHLVGCECSECRALKWTSGFPPGYGEEQ